MPSRAAATLPRLALERLLRRPHTVTEYNHPAPNDYRAECVPMLAAFAGLQDWDGIFQFDYGSQPSDWRDARIQGFFQMVTDPAAVVTCGGETRSGAREHTFGTAAADVADRRDQGDRGAEGEGLEAAAQQIRRPQHRGEAHEEHPQR